MAESAVLINGFSTILSKVPPKLALLPSVFILEKDRGPPLIPFSQPDNIINRQMAMPVARDIFLISIGRCLAVDPVSVDPVALREWKFLGGESGKLLKSRPKQNFS